MDLEQEYLQYVIQFSLSMGAVSATYFLSLDKPITLLTLVFFPVLLGYTTYISRDNFQLSSLLSLSALILVLLPKVAVFAAVIAVLNPLTSVFASGKSFRDFYHAAALPMLLTGILLAGGFFAYSQTHPEQVNNFRNTTVNLISQQTQEILNTNIENRARERSKLLVRQTARNTVLITQSSVLNNTELSNQAKAKLSSAFQNAEQEVPQKVVNRSFNRSTEMRTVKTTENTLKQVLDRQRFVLLALPGIVLVFYSLHPLIGLLTALSASVFRRIDDIES
ncbi:MAG: hypothetical protein ABEJ83_05585 [Candidatus Nanohaloarchaea archaeon]